MAAKGFDDVEEFRRALLQATGVSVCSRVHFGRPQPGEPSVPAPRVLGIDAREIVEGLAKMKAYLTVERGDVPAWLRCSRRADDATGRRPAHQAQLAAFDTFDLFYRTLCAVMYNYVPLSGHPGGSISSGRFVTAAVRRDGLRPCAPRTPGRRHHVLRGRAQGARPVRPVGAAQRGRAHRGAGAVARRRKLACALRTCSASAATRVAMPPFTASHAKALDGHPTPATPFVRLSTGASGVGLPARSALPGGADLFGTTAPRIHIIEGEGGLTPGRVCRGARGRRHRFARQRHPARRLEPGLDRLERVCREGDVPGRLRAMGAGGAGLPPRLERHPGPRRLRLAADRGRAALALDLDNGQPTAVVYRTLKGWQYGIEGRASHGAGHALCSAGFSRRRRVPEARLLPRVLRLPTCDAATRAARRAATVVEQCYWEALEVVRARLGAARRWTHWQRGCARRASGWRIAARTPPGRPPHRGRLRDRRRSGANRRPPSSSRARREDHSARGAGRA